MINRTCVFIVATAAASVLNSFWMSCIARIDIISSKIRMETHIVLDCKTTSAIRVEEYIEKWRSHKQAQRERERGCRGGEEGEESGEQLQDCHIIC